jgi:hypothetical protein
MLLRISWNDHLTSNLAQQIASRRWNQQVDFNHLKIKEGVVGITSEADLYIRSISYLTHGSNRFHGSWAHRTGAGLVQSTYLSLRQFKIAWIFSVLFRNVLPLLWNSVLLLNCLRLIIYNLHWQILWSSGVMRLFCTFFLEMCSTYYHVFMHGRGDKSQGACLPHSHRWWIGKRSMRLWASAKLEDSAVPTTMTMFRGSCKYSKNLWTDADSILSIFWVQRWFQMEKVWTIKL